MRPVTAILPKVRATRNMSRRSEEHTNREFERSNMAHSPPLFPQSQGAWAVTSDYAAFMDSSAELLVHV